MREEIDRVRFHKHSMHRRRLLVRRLSAASPTPVKLLSPERNASANQRANEACNGNEYLVRIHLRQPSECLRQRACVKAPQVACRRRPGRRSRLTLSGGVGEDSLRCAPQPCQPPAMAYEYTTVKLLGVLTKAAERDWPGILNAKAAEGWRLVNVDDSVAFFERQVSA